MTDMMEFTSRPDRIRKRTPTVPARRGAIPNAVAGSDGLECIREWTAQALRQRARKNSGVRVKIGTVLWRT